MAVWYILILIIVLAVNESAHRRAFNKTDHQKHKRNRFALLDRFLDVGSVKEGNRFHWPTLDYWKLPQSATFQERLRIGLSGIGANLVLAWAIFTGLALFNMPVIFDGQYAFEDDVTVLRDDLRVIAVEPTPQGEPLVEPNAIPLTLGTERIRDKEHFEELTQHFAGRSVEFEYLDTLGERSISLPIEEDGFSGVTIDQVTVNRFGLSAPLVGAVTTMQAAYFSVSALWSGAGDAASGIELLQNGIWFGFSFMFFLFAYANVVNALLNLLPMKPFDVGRMLWSGTARRLRKSQKAPRSQRS